MKKTGILSGSKRLLIPAGLDLREHLPLARHRDLDKYYYLIHKIYEERHRNKLNGADDYVHLNAKILEGLLSGKFTAIKRELKSIGVIEVHEPYRAGVKSKGYRLALQYHGRQAVTVPLKDRALLKNLSKFRAKQASKESTFQVGTPEYDSWHHQKPWVVQNLHKVHVDFPSAYAYIESKMTTWRRPFFSNCFPFGPFSSPPSSKEENTGFSVHLTQPKTAPASVVVSKGRRWQVREHTTGNGSMPQHKGAQGVGVSFKRLSYVLSFGDPFEDVETERVEKERGEGSPLQHTRKLLGPIPLRVPVKNKKKPGSNFRWVKLKFGNFSKLLTRRPSLKNFDFQRQNSYQNDKFAGDLASILALSHRGPGDLFCERDSVGYRVHTNLTNLRGELRQFLYLESGERLVNLDIKTSQPTLFNTLLDEYYRGKEWPADALLYRKLTCDPKEDLYRYMMEQLKKPITKASRNAFKREFFGKIFYNDFKENYLFQQRKVFRRIFPNVYEVLSYYKVPDFKQLPIEMQKRESQLIIDTVCYGLFQDYGDPFFCATIHDSIVTTESNAPYVKAKMEEAFSRLYQFVPHITFERLTK